MKFCQEKNIVFVFCVGERGGVVSDLFLQRTKSTHILFFFFFFFFGGGGGGWNGRGSFVATG